MAPLLGVIACGAPDREFSNSTAGRAGSPSSGGGAAPIAGTPAGGIITALGGVSGTSGAAGGEPGGAGGTGGAAGSSARAGAAGTVGDGGSLSGGGTTGTAGSSGTAGTTPFGGFGPGGESAGGVSAGGSDVVTAGMGGSGGEGGVASQTGGSIGLGGAGGDIGIGGFGGAGRLPGEACSAGAECESLTCLDGVCCLETACPECMDCGTTGRCTTQALGRKDPTGKECTGARACSLAGVCQVVAGQPCTAATECLDGFCADGVCCKSACSGLCQTCDANGDCQTTRLAEDDSCRTDSTGVRMCDGGGVCSVPHMITDVNKVAATIVTNTNPSYPREFTQGPDGRIYFTANDGVAGEELWVTDGTAGGTVMVANLNGTANSYPRGLINAGSNLFFSALGTDGFAKLYATNGNGVRVVKDIAPGFTALPMNSLSARAMGNVVYFSGCTSANGCELWRSDGTDAGTVMVADIMKTMVSGSTTANYGSNPSEFAIMNGAVYFRAADSVTVSGTTTSVANYELWKSDGATNTVRVADIDPGVGSGNPGYLTAVPTVNGPRLLFSAMLAGTNQELYVSDGNVGNLSVLEINPGATSSSPGPFTVMGNRAYFPATDATNGRELWSSDGTPAPLGTYLVKDIFVGTSHGNPTAATVSGNQLYFGANDGASTGVGLWKSDGTTAGTTKVFSGFTPTGTIVFQTAEFGSRIFIATAGGSGTQELWVTDGTTAGTYKACPNTAQACGRSFATNPSGFAVIGGRMYFNASATDVSTGVGFGAEPFVYP